MLRQTLHRAIRRKSSLFTLLLALFSPVVHAQAHSGCQVVPKTFAATRNCFRVLLVFAPRPNDALLARQIHLLDGDADDMMDRFILYTPVSPNPRALQTPLDAPWTILPAEQMALIRRQFHIPVDHFTVLLLDEDGRIMLRSSDPVDPFRMNAIIDRTPLREAEMRRRGAN